MKILFAGGGTGGHFYPIIAIAEKINEIADKEKLINIKLFLLINFSEFLVYENKAQFCLSQSPSNFNA